VGHYGTALTDCVDVLYFGYMQKDHKVLLGLKPDDLALLDAAKNDLGINNRTDVVRVAIRALAKERGLDAGAVIAAAEAKTQKSA